MLYRHYRNAIHVQHFRRYLHGRYLYVVINLITGKAKEKKISVLMYVLAILFVLKYIFI